MNRSATVAVGKDTIVNLAKVGPSKLQVKRKYKFVGEGRINLWFVGTGYCLNAICSETMETGEVPHVC